MGRGQKFCNTNFFKVRQAFQCNRGGREVRNSSNLRDVIYEQPLLLSFAPCPCIAKMHPRLLLGLLVTYIKYRLSIGRFEVQKLSPSCRSLQQSRKSLNYYKLLQTSKIGSFRCLKSSSQCLFCLTSCLPIEICEFICVTVKCHFLVIVVKDQL